MLPTNTNYDAKHALDYSTPLALIHFDGEAVDYCGHEPTSPDNTLKRYLKEISGTAQRVIPESGKASIGGVTITINDVDDEITALLATDSYYFHRKKVTVKVGYAGMAEADLLTVMIGWITDYKKSNDLLSYIFEVTDPRRWFQRYIFREADDTNVTIQGNPINLLLAILTSTGAKTNGDHDWLAAINSLGIDDDFINVSNIEKIRDSWFPADSNYMHFTITDRIKAKDWFEKEIFQPLNLYPVIDGQGRFDLKVAYKPPFPAIEESQSFDDDDIIGQPSWDANLSGVINELELHYDWDGSDFASIDWHINSDSLNNRGPGKKPLIIKSKGFHTSSHGSRPDRATDVLARRKNAVFGRFATPPPKIKFKTHYFHFLTEAGDVCPFTHSLLPDVEAGTPGISSERMEVVNRNPNFKDGTVQFELWGTGFDKSNYCVISPSMTVTAGASGTEFTVSATDAAKYANLTSPEVGVYDSHMREQAAPITILTVNTTTGVITCDDIGSTPVAGWIISFADYSDLTAEQQLFWSIRASGSHLITP